MWVGEEYCKSRGVGCVEVVGTWSEWVEAEAKDRGDMTLADSPTALEARVSGRSHCWLNSAWYLIHRVIKCHPECRLADLSSNGMATSKLMGADGPRPHWTILWFVFGSNILEHQDTAQLYTHWHSSPRIPTTLHLRIGTVQSSSACDILIMVDIPAGVSTTHDGFI